ncbi:hypothetical protein, unlikely [Trypanosoma brucei gambiense DAL972]|uniref:T. brucei spp.-specific protein n=1 Tax=Trypanosoma brucei gambiense (strain MHOM/CI/86/DAL972) TaxID=679716 RepID=C9ZNJ7_TRYB9|nr:hypothetical protein, unlikely [Trypanosoma brucei gambiense DAL972]CBH10975.1 hypothetical protein, unlikely [Trypanosoma brucei gambiense DAL972]|eukprot:XP_011773262.1 hypothetical protein, unlikely [Trypanosoma brucei gambiense DAL972]
MISLYLFILFSSFFWLLCFVVNSALGGDMVGNRHTCFRGKCNGCCRRNVGAICLLFRLILFFIFIIIVVRRIRKTRIHTYIHEHIIYIHIYVYVYMFIYLYIFLKVLLFLSSYLTRTFSFFSFSFFPQILFSLFLPSATRDSVHNWRSYFLFFLFLGPFPLIFLFPHEYIIILQIKRKVHLQ